MAIAMSSGIETPPIPEMPEVKWEVFVTSEEEDAWEWVAKADTKDEADELVESLSKRYYVTISSVKKG